MMSSHHDLASEAAYWGDCANTFDEDQKHWVYARLMGIRQEHWSLIHPGGLVIDIGGGPASMLLKCRRINGEILGHVWDPLPYPTWTRARYQAHGIAVARHRGEELTISDAWDEAWIYNCLQHTDDPALVVRNALRAAPVLRIAEWIDIPPHDGHPHMLTAALLQQWTGAEGQITELAESGCYGRMWSVVVHRPEPVMPTAQADAMDGPQRTVVAGAAG
jgi:hypothetical protein